MFTPLQERLFDKHGGKLTGKYSLRLSSKLEKPQTGISDSTLNLLKVGTLYILHSGNTEIIHREHGLKELDHFAHIYTFNRGRLEDLGVDTDQLSAEILGRYEALASRTSRRPTLHDHYGNKLNPKGAEVKLASGYTFQLNGNPTAEPTGFIILEERIRRTSPEELRNISQELVRHYRR